MTICKEFLCDKNTTCLYAYGKNVCGDKCYYKSCTFCRLRQTCKQYKEEVIRQQKKSRLNQSAKKQEKRETGLEPATPTLARSCSTN